LNVAAFLAQFWSTAVTHLRSGIRLDLRSTVSRDCVLEAPVAIGQRVKLVGCQVGRGSYISGDCRLSAVRFGRFCSVGAHLHVADGRHPTRDWASTHPAFFSRRAQAGFTFADGEVYEELRRCKGGWTFDVGHDVWIGDRVTVLAGLRVGTGAVIGTGSVVTRDVEEYTIVAGVPAREVGRRCSREEAIELLRTAWWERDLPWLRSHWREFRTVNSLLRALSEVG
jgi:acetyltransferase-like isoleucine patch superfamily enzyme